MRAVQGTGQDGCVTCRTDSLICEAVGRLLTSSTDVLGRCLPHLLLTSSTDVADSGPTSLPKRVACLHSTGALVGFQAGRDMIRID